MLAIQKSILSILLIGKNYFNIFLIGFSLNIFFYKAKFIYYLIIDNKIIKKVDYI